MGYIELMGISKSYNKQSNVLNGIDLTIEKGEFFVLVGPSGSGKSTLLRMIAGLEEISGGTLKISGEIVNHLPPKNRNLSMVFQNYALYPHLSVEQNILFGLHAKKIDKEIQRKRLEETAEMMGLSELLKRKPRELSGGQRQRVALARAVVSEAPLCLMDEPLSNLDAKLRANMRIEIRRLQKRLGLTMVYVTHDQVEAMTMGDRIMVLNDGIIQQVGEPIELYNKPANLFVATFIGSPKMNLGKAVLKDSKLLIENALEVPLEQMEVPTSLQNRDLVIGLRAEHMPHGSEQHQIQKVEIVNVEHLGNETLISFEVGTELWTAKWLGQWLVQVGDIVPIHISVENMCFFDADTGCLIQEAAFSQKQEVVSK
ncbi:ABC transporter ATP-binding protein [Ureibacillus chungkukjangi]|uniref:Carbohydrate ABC transporter ATP-binding protein (CUT1 family) n=1 Tax=Ureibacillus chungkukjangi TaxID=1202712 RepID=A0A318TWB7_9BACL|nr:ABC transporter ATP-binding protein [Ureibacillus chungkukjangi]MCM3387740.1 ABC transporter ATP-binding protein [Ureibacillus chungkukjangi]PYF08057.1 carbohydrate ABC transporter ATP-binding protein (CUT1 family) [Ureibacillus chungkukjangi]